MHKRKKTAIYGGSFDPPHKGHTFIIKNLLKNFDRVIILPAFVSPFKAAPDEGKALGDAVFGAGAGQRLKMLDLALKEENLSPEISDYEIKKKGISYTIDSVNHFFNPFEEFYLVIGCENIKTLHYWKDFDKLKELVTFYVVPRESFDLPDQKELHFNIQFAPFNPPEISSSHVKAAIAFNKPETLIDKSVKEYIKEHNLYNQYSQYTAAYQTFNLEQERIEHTYCAVEYGINLAKTHNVDANKTIIALMLHDIGKNAGNACLAAHNIKTGDDLSNIPQSVKHAFISAEIASQYFDINDTDILNAIRFHTTARPGMSVLEKVVFLSDKLESSRDYNGVEKIRQTAKTDLNKAVALVLAGTIEKLLRENKEIDPLTQIALDYYKKGE